MENLDRALEKLPKYEGDLNRSITLFTAEAAEEFYNSFKINQKYVPGQYLSMTKTGMYNEEGQVQIFVQNARNGKDLHGWNDIENEVLYPRNVTFRVVNKTKYEGMFYILLEEVE